ncbi:potassium transporter TrkA, partial [filamentous cyanobacterium CCP5]
MGALASLLIAIATSLLITRIAAVALAMTGLSKDSAPFQA